MNAKKLIHATGIFFRALGIIVLILVLGMIVLMFSQRFISKGNAVELAVPKSVLETGEYPATAEALLKEYLKLDAEGANLSKKGTEYLQKLNPIESFYSLRLNYVGVIIGYRILRIQSGNDESTAIIEYDMVGTLEHLVKFQPRREKEQHLVSLRKYEGKWRLDSELWPRISVATAVSYLEQKNGPKKEDRNKKLIDEIGQTSQAKPVGGELPEGVEAIAVLVRQYCELEAKGLIGSPAFEKDKREYVTDRFHKVMPTERAFITSKFWVNQVNVYRNTASATVLYEVSNEYNGSEFEPVAYSTSGQILGLVKTPKGWRIDSSNKSNPFVYEYVVRQQGVK